MKKRIIFVTTVFGLFTSLITLACPFVIKLIVDDLSAGYVAQKAYEYFLIIVAVYVFSLAFDIASSFINNKLSVKFKTHESHNLYASMMKMRYGVLIEKQPTYLGDRIFNSIETVYTYYSSVAKNYIINSLQILICIGFAYYFSLWVGVVLTVAVPCYLAMYLILNKKLQEKCVKLQQLNSKSFANVISVINDVDYYKQLPDHESILQIVDNNIRSVNDENAKVNNFGQSLHHTISRLLDLTYSIIYLLISINFVLGKLGLSDYVFVSMIVALVFPATNGIVNANVSVRDLKAANDFLDNELNANREASGTKTLASVRKIDFDVKQFGFGDNSLLNDIKFSMSAGEKIFISGPSGCGKSSLIKCLLKFFDAQSIYVNGIDIKEYDNASYRQKFAFISQNIPIIPGTIEDNVLLGTKQDIAFLKDKTFMKKFINLPQGFDTQIYDNGANLSGGDKQKIALARLYLRSCDVIILDESLNAIDSESKSDILNTLFSEFSDKLIIMISHEKELSKRFDRHLEISENTIHEII